VDFCRSVCERPCKESRPAAQVRNPRGYPDLAPFRQRREVTAASLFCTACRSSWRFADECLLHPCVRVVRCVPGPGGAAPALVRLPNRLLVPRVRTHAAEKAAEVAAVRSPIAMSSCSPTKVPYSVRGQIWLAHRRKGPTKCSARPAQDYASVSVHVSARFHPLVLPDIATESDRTASAPIWFPPTSGI
jgi:hypothetical protein